MIGKPYSGKPNVRFDEGELEIEHSATTPALYSTANKKQNTFDKKYLGNLDIQDELVSKPHETTSLFYLLALAL